MTVRPAALLFVSVVPVDFAVSAVSVNSAALLLALWVTPPTLPPTDAMVTVPAPEPELVMSPVLLTEVVIRLMPFAAELLLLRIRLPVPITPPETVRVLPPLLASVVPLVPLTVNAPVLIVTLWIALFALMPVTLLPTPPLSVNPVWLIVPPIKVTEPALLTKPDSVKPPVVPEAE